MITREEVLQSALIAHAHNIKSKMDWYKDEASSAWWQLECEELELAKALLRGLENGNFRVMEVEG